MVRTKNRFGPALRLAVVASIISGGIFAVAAADRRQAPRGDAPPRCLRNDGLQSIPAGTVRFNEDGAAVPGEEKTVSAFRIDRHEVTNRQFARFVEATGHVTQAERDGISAVFVLPENAPDMDPRRWWKMVEGASWRHPTGPASTLVGREDYPVVQVTYADALAYARWAGRDLPDQVEWERAARGRQVRSVEPTHWAFADDGKPMANTWQGVFPVRDSGQDAFVGIAPVGCFPANDFGLHDMIGNVWEWTSSRHGDARHHVIKGGSFLCSRNYCSNFRPAGWQSQETDLATSHIGFRTVARDGG